MHSTPETRQNAQAVLDYLEKNPNQHRQNFFWAPKDQPQTLTDEAQAEWISRLDELKKPIEHNVCDTTMCIAGTAVFLNEGIPGLVSCISAEYEDVSFINKGADYLGLDDSEAQELFYTMSEQSALDALRAVAEGNEDKFWEVMENRELDEIIL